MSILAIILPLLFLAQADAPRTGKMEGTMRVLVEIVVRDQQTAAPLAGVSVTYVRSAESGRPDQADNAMNTTASTDAQGIAHLPCIFDAAFHYAGSMANIVRWEWRPGGEIQLNKDGYATATVQLAAAFPSPPYIGTTAPTAVVVALRAK